MIAIFVQLSVFLTYHALADDISLKLNNTSDKSSENKKIHISADRLVSYSDDGYIEFIGNVRATQKDGVVEADSLKVFLKINQAKNKITTDEDSIKKIVAAGNVKIVFNNRIATAQQAVYTTKDSVLILSGPDSKVVSGNDSISGAKIILYRVDGRIKVESSAEKRVEAVFYPRESDKGKKDEKETGSGNLLPEF